MEESPELGEGHNTTVYRELDARIGRWWSVDPVSAKFPHKSPYLMMSNSPIMMIDPKGDTDYYNRKGGWIGSDNIDNGNKKMVLTRVSAQQIRQAHKRNQMDQLNIGQFRDIIDVPSEAEIAAMHRVYTRMARSGREEGFVVGIVEHDITIKTPIKLGSSAKIWNVKISEQQIVDLAPGADANINVGLGYAEIIQNGGTPTYDAHSHPAMVRHDRADEFSLSGPGSSDGDQLTTRNLEQMLGLQLKPQVVLGLDSPNNMDMVHPDDQAGARNNTGNWVPLRGIFKKVITHYDGNGDVETKQSFKKFEKASTRAREHNPNEE